jgi:hypothetical protein
MWLAVFRTAGLEPEFRVKDTISSRSFAMQLGGAFEINQNESPASNV